MEEKKSLSWLQILTIMVALAIAAKTVPPRLAGASTESKVSTLIDGLQIMRANLDLYRAENRGFLPPTETFKGFKITLTTNRGFKGSYMKEIPTNPFNGLNTVRFDGEPAGAGKAGWKLDTKTGSFQADNNREYAAL